MKRLVVVLISVALPLLFCPDSTGVGCQESQPDPYLRYVERLDAFENLLKDNGSITEEQIGKLETLLEELEATSFKNLTSRTRMVLFLLRKNGNNGSNSADFPPETEETLTIRRPDTARNIAKWTAFGTGVLSLGFFNLFSILGDRTYQEYISEPSGSRNEELVQITNTYDTLSYVFGGVAVLGMGIWIVLTATDPVEP